MKKSNLAIQSFIFRGQIFGPPLVDLSLFSRTFVRILFSAKFVFHRPQLVDGRFKLVPLVFQLRRSALDILQNGVEITFVAPVLCLALQQIFFTFDQLRITTGQAHVRLDEFADSSSSGGQLSDALICQAYNRTGWVRRTPYFLKPMHFWPKVRQFNVHHS